MTVPPWLFVVVLAAAAFLIGLSKGGLGSGMGALITPAVSLALPNVAMALGLLLPMLIVGDAFAVYVYWGQWDGGLVRRLLPAALLGVALGVFVLVGLPAKSMRLAVGVFTLAVVVYKIAGDSLRRLRYRPRPWHAPAAGAMSGLASTLFNAGGPPLTTYLILNEIPPRPFIATSAIFFAILNASKVPAFVATRAFNLPLLFSVWWAFPFVPLGIWLGRRLIDRIDPRTFERTVMGLSVLASGLLIWQSL